MTRIWWSIGIIMVTASLVAAMLKTRVLTLNLPPPPFTGFGAGEEKAAYSSFIAYYKTEIKDCHNDMPYFVNETYAGRAVYAGDSLWHFYIQIGYADLAAQDVEFKYKEEVVDIHSLPGQSWEDLCSPESHNSADSS